MFYDLKLTTDTRVTPVFKAKLTISNDPSYFLSVHHQNFDLSTTGFTHPNGGWMGFCIKLCVSCTKLFIMNLSIHDKLFLALIFHLKSCTDFWLHIKFKSNQINSVLRTVSTQQPACLRWSGTCDIVFFIFAKTKLCFVVFFWGCTKKLKSMHWWPRC